MSYIKRWLEDHIDDFSDDELKSMGYDDDDIINLRLINHPNYEREKS